MVSSMTAYARCAGSVGEGRWVWELRSVNHRYLEVSVRLPEELRALEGPAREAIGARVKRGKVECSLRPESGTGAAPRLAINEDLVRALATASARIAAIVGDEHRSGTFEFLRWPGVVETPIVDADTTRERVLALLERALTELVQTREREGAKLAGFIAARTQEAHAQVQRLRVQLPGILAGLRERLSQRVGELAVPLDPGRLEQEVLLMTGRMDVAEEIDRLEAHLAEVTRVLATGEPIGRRLDFLMQELNREANTIGSKSAHLDSTAVSVELKVLIEQMREQVQNVE